jgi:hypothetical protein
MHWLKGRGLNNSLFERVQESGIMSMNEAVGDRQGARVSDVRLYMYGHGSQRFNLNMILIAVDVMLVPS